ncbi:unnamed protein product, partial [Rotaria sordida]
MMLIMTTVFADGVASPRIIPCTACPWDEQQP